MTRIVQLVDDSNTRWVATVNEPDLILLDGVSSVYELAQRSLAEAVGLDDLVLQLTNSKSLSYDPIYQGSSDWKLLPCFDHPTDPMHCMISGTGLTHKASAANRQQMHEASDTSTLTDSMRMYLMGEEGGKPSPGMVGVQPEWFYKGNGSDLRGHNESLEVPSFAEDGGEEPEIAGLYVCDGHGKPFRVGFSTGNEFSDHVMEKRNYLYLAPSKLRSCSIGPELWIGSSLENLLGTVSISRQGQEIWSKKVRTGEENIVHSFANLEYHHFKYPGHRLPGLAHVHFFGADAFSFGEKIKLQHDDLMTVHWEGMGRPLKNKLVESSEDETFFEIPGL